MKMLRQECTERMLEKYLLPSKYLSFVEKKTGTYYAFKSPSRQNYYADDSLWAEKLSGPTIPKNFRPSMLLIDDTFTINNGEFSGLLQYKRQIHGEYYVMQTKNGLKFIFTCADIDVLPDDEKMLLLRC
jgi:hypothetical protein